MSISLFDTVDVLLCPSAPGEAPEGVEFTGDPRFNSIWTLAGTPCVTLPAGTGAKGLPLGIQLVGLAPRGRPAALHRRLGRGPSRLRLVMPSINGERLLGDLRRIADFGRYQTGVHRPHLSPQDVESRHWLAGRMKEAGLEPVIDGVGNVIGRSPKSGPRLLMGSHTDTQPRGGWLDGVMGVIYGLEVARALAEDPDTAHLAVDVASWADEGRAIGAGMIGSRSFIGHASPRPTSTPRAIATTARKMRDALKAAGLDKAPRVAARGGPLSLAISRPISSRAVCSRRRDKRIGVVTAIVGIYQYRLTFSGIQNHAGTTPMPIRKDAGVAMMRLYNEVMDRFPRWPAAQRVDRRQDVGRARRARDHPRQGRDDPAVPRRRRRRAAALGSRACWRSSRRTRSAGPCTIECVNLSRTMPAADGRAPARRASTRRRRSMRRTSTCACRRAPATTRRSWRSACRRP